MTDQVAQEAPALIGIGAQSIVDRAKELGLTWTLRPAVVTRVGDSANNNNTEIIYDGDTVPIGCVNVTGNTLTLGQRVMGLIFPPSGNLIIGLVEPVDSWQTPTLINGWVNYDTTVWQGARYRKLSNGMVTIQGLVKNGTGPPSDIFFLPVGYRPAKNLLFASIGNNVFARVDVYSTGSVNWSLGGTNSFVSISVSFFAG
jgi:hypothetical protein